MNKYFVLVLLLFLTGCAQQEYMVKPPPKAAPDKNEYISAGAKANGWELAHAFKPLYGRRQLHYGYEGWAVMEFTIEADGTTSDIKVLESSVSDPKYSFNGISKRNIENLKYRRIDNTLGKRTPGIIKVLTYEIAE